MNIRCEKLTDAVVGRLFYYSIVVCYNFETNAWNKNRYNGYAITDQKADTERVKEFKSAMDKEPEFSQRYEFVVSVTMTINKAFYPGWGKPISNPEYNKMGDAIVGNIIVKNKATGKYELYCKSWVGVYVFNCPFNAVDRGANGFADSGARDSDFRAALIAAHTR